MYYESYQDVQVAIGREKQINRWRREKKIALIEKMNPRWQDLAENWGREMRFQGESLARNSLNPQRRARILAISPLRPQALRFFGLRSR